MVKPTSDLDFLYRTDLSNAKQVIENIHECQIDKKDKIKLAAAYAEKPRVAFLSTVAKMKEKYGLKNANKQ